MSGLTVSATDSGGNVATIVLGYSVSTPPSTRPDASNTGVPAGTTLTPSGALTITQAGTVVQDLDISGRIEVQAPNVTIRRCRIRTSTSTYPIEVESGATNVLIEDCEVDNLNGTGIAILFSGGSSGTVRRANIHSCEDGVRIGADNVIIEDTYIHHLFRQVGGHHDCIQIRAGDNCTIQRCNLQAYVFETDDRMNAAIQIGSLSGTNPISNFQVLDNYMDGGNYTINGGSPGDVDSALYARNRFGRNYNFGVRGNIYDSTWEATNVWDDTGLPVA